MPGQGEYPNGLLDNAADLVWALNAAKDEGEVLKARHDLAVRDHNEEALKVNQKVDTILVDRNLDPGDFTIERTAEGELQIVRKVSGAEPLGSLRVAMR